MLGGENGIQFASVKELEMLIVGFNNTPIDNSVCSAKRNSNKD